MLGHRCVFVPYEVETTYRDDMEQALRDASITVPVSFYCQECLRVVGPEDFEELRVPLADRVLTHIGAARRVLESVADTIASVRSRLSGDSDREPVDVIAAGYNLGGLRRDDL